MRKKSILVTGAGGFAGRYIASALAEAGHDVIAPIRDPDKATRLQEGWPPNVRVIIGDLFDRALLPNDGIDLIAHAAAQCVDLGVSDDVYQRGNADLTAHLVEYAQEIGVSTFFLFSTISVYGPIGVPVLTEQHPTLASHPYGRSKLLGEQALQHAGATLSGVIIRCPAILGADATSNFLVTVVKKAVRDEVIHITNPDGLFNNVVEVSDLAKLVTMLVVREHSGIEVINLSSGDSVTVGEVVRRIVAKVGSKSEITVMPSDDKPFTISHARAARLYGFSPMSVMSAIDRFVVQEHLGHD